MTILHRLVLLRVLGKPMYDLILAFSLAVYWRGHNEPGGGFIGGLLAVSATLLLSNTHGVVVARRYLPFRSHVRLAAFGVLCAIAAGSAGLLAGHSFMRHLWWEAPMPWGSLALSTVQLFDLGVYFCVWGGIGGYASELLALGDDDCLEMEASVEAAHPTAHDQHIVHVHDTLNQQASAQPSPQKGAA